MQMVDRPQLPSVGNDNRQSTLLNDGTSNDAADVIDVDASGDAGSDAVLAAVVEGNNGIPVLPRNIHNTRIAMAKTRG